ncbi:MAG: IS3 family transposase [Sphingobacterium sp.]
MSVKARLSLVDPSDKISIRKQCDLLQIHRSGLYYKPKGETEENLQIMKLLDEQYFKTPFYGSRKLTVLLIQHGFNVNKKRVKRLMRKINWQTIYREPRTTICTKGHKTYPYLLRNLSITHKNQVWATDITYIPMKKGFMYLCAIMDLHTRCVLNWSVSNSMSADWCAQVLQQTIDQHGTPEIFNTDQGSQYTSDIHIKVLKDNNIKISMDGRGRAIDNIFIERLWRSVKYEDVYLRSYRNGLELYHGLKIYFKFYNTERFHESLNYKTPDQNYKKPIAA